MTHRFELVGDTKVAVFDGHVDNEMIAHTIAAYRTQKKNDEPFGLMNLNTVVEHFLDWKLQLPRVEPFYAVKCNNDPVLLKTLADLGTGFDCASKAEINMILDGNLAPTDKIIYAHPCKTRSFIEHARKHNVKMMTFDNEEELQKINGLYPDAELVLRIAVSDPSAQCPLGIKFGCEPSEVAPKLLQKSAAMGMKVIGISFHVGSGCNDPAAFQLAISYARNLFDIGKSMDHDMYLLDIGGGFPGNDHEKFSRFASIIRTNIDEYFPPSENVRIIAEPGRYFASASISITTNIMSATKVPASRITKDDGDSDKDGYMYYMNDGVYGSFNCILFDHFQPTGRPLFPSSDIIPSEEYPTTVWGPTCDGLDQVEKETKMRRMQVGEWLYYPDMGAYTKVCATNFNGFEPPTYYYFMDNATWSYMYAMENGH